MKNYYNALELGKNCTEKEIKDSYIKLSKKYHPDVNNSEDAKKKIVEINEAYSVLKNASTRLQYDEKLLYQNTQQRSQQSSHGNSTYRPYYSHQSHTHDEYTKYYQQMYSRRNAAEPKGRFTILICCCMLMMFGAGLRIMYARSDAFRRKHLSDVTAKRIAEMASNSDNPEVEKFKVAWLKMQEKDMKSEPHADDVKD